MIRAIRIGCRIPPEPDRVAYLYSLLLRFYYRDYMVATVVFVRLESNMREWHSAVHHFRLNLFVSFQMFVPDSRFAASKIRACELIQNLHIFVWIKMKQFDLIWICENEWWTVGKVTHDFTAMSKWWAKIHLWCWLYIALTSTSHTAKNTIHNFTFILLTSVHRMERYLEHLRQHRSNENTYNIYLSQWNLMTSCEQTGNNRLAKSIKYL